MFQFCFLKGLTLMFERGTCGDLSASSSSLTNAGFAFGGRPLLLLSDKSCFNSNPLIFQLNFIVNAITCLQTNEMLYCIHVQ